KIDLKKLENDPDALYDLLDSIDSEVEMESHEEETVTEVLEEEIAVPQATQSSDEEETDSEDDVPLAYLESGWKPGLFSSKEDPLVVNSTNSPQSPWHYFQKYLGADFYSLGAKLSDVMPRDMFYLLRVNFHAVDVLGVPGEIQKENRLWKLQPIIDMIRNHCRSLERKPKSSYSIDEQMIPFLGRCPVRQYVRNKPRPVDLKNVVLTTSEGKILDFEIYQGKLTPFQNKDLGLGASVILHLSHILPKESYLFIDRYFSTESLFDRLISLEIYGTGTIMPNR
ncbi:piggyBac transposable element-derived protein 3-like, partial [Sitophilus oryzae]|uniref:PiggyBac transposable element-derived protein 3-like n=1 Tax=Sitophilus oryzae TaxID=7048 RepID=A0A6J2YSG6_SITOR